ncbi:hypothetical protein [Pseudomonas sp. 22 E 5]|nr:hypothetical protein [Pseudomonas sp. 22 E 5]
MLEWDLQRRHEEIIFASTSPDLALRTVEHQVKRYGKSLLALLDLAEPGQDTPAYQALLALDTQCQAHAATIRTLINDAGKRVFEFAFCLRACR